MPYVKGAQKPTPPTGKRPRRWPNTEDPDNVADSWANPDVLGSSSRRRRRPSMPLARVVSRSDTNAALDTLGDTTTAREPAVISAWKEQVKLLKVWYRTIAGALLQEQATVTRIPRGPNTGQLAYKSRAPQETAAGPNYLYTLAPADVRAADVAEGAAVDSSKSNWATTIDQGASQTGELVQRLATGTAKTVGDTTKGFLGGLLGIPSWSIPVVLGASALLAAKILLPGLVPWGRR